MGCGICSFIIADGCVIWTQKLQTIDLDVVKLISVFNYRGRKRVQCDVVFYIARR